MPAPCLCEKTFTPPCPILGDGSWPLVGWDPTVLGTPTFGIVGYTAGFFGGACCGVVPAWDGYFSSAFTDMGGGGGYITANFGPPGNQWKATFYYNCLGKTMRLHVRRDPAELVCTLWDGWSVAALPVSACSDISFEALFTTCGTGPAVVNMKYQIPP